MLYETGSIIADKYRIISFLGKTDSQEMYRVVRNDQKAERLLKVIPKNEAGLGTLKLSCLISKYKLETQLSVQLHSPATNPYIVQVFEFIESETIVMLEMEYAPGGSLNDRLQMCLNKSVRMEREKAIKIAMEIATGLTRLHDLGIVHRNLIPKNILFDQYDQAKIADYGQSQISSGPSLRSPFANPNQHPGTPGYMSPEQRLSSERLSPSSDIYALGLILFEMLTGHVYSNLRPRTRVSDLIPGVKPSLNDLVARMLSEFPNDRPRDGREAANELHREFIAEELAQREAQAKKRRELDEWERLKNEELSRESGIRQVTQRSTNPGVMPADISISPEDQKTQPRETVEIQKNQKDNLPVEEVVAEAVASPKLEGASSSPAIVDESLPRTTSNSGWKKFWWVIIPVVVAALALPITLIKPEKPDVLEPTTNVPVVLPTIQNTPTMRTLHSQTAMLSTAELIQPEKIATEIVQAITQAPGPTITETVKIADSTAPAKQIPETIIRDASFENGDGWELKVGDYHIQGQLSRSWASLGEQSYQLSLTGDRNFDYCFTPGMRTTINQSIDLTNVKSILFDLHIRPAIYSGSSHGDNSKPRAVVFVDGSPVFTLPENSFGEKLNQKILLDGKFSGKHDVKLGLMVMSKLCVKSESDAESFLVYFDNIRFEY